MILDILGEIGEGCCMGIGLTVSFAIFLRLFSRKTLSLKVLLPAVGGFFIGCVGVYIGGFISDIGAIVGGILFFILGVFMSINLSG